MPNDLLTQNEAAKLFGVTRQYISLLVNGSKTRAAKVKSYTGAKLVSKRELEMVILKNK